MGPGRRHQRRGAVLAGGIADADQLAAALHQPPIGFINPLLYSLERGPGNGVLRDITLGNNDLGKLIDQQATGCCSAHVGYDRASGLGSVNVSALARQAARAYGARPRVSRRRPIRRGRG